MNVNPLLLGHILDSDLDILIAGPTASGKSSLALDLAKRTNGVIVNGDALQVYDCWRVLTARPDAADVAKAPHELYGNISRTKRYSVGAWLDDVTRVRARYPGRRLIITGGTGLYFTALTKGLADIPHVPHEVHVLAQDLINQGRVEVLLSDLKASDPTTVSRIDTQNPVRIQRAWEVWKTTGLGLAAWQDKETHPQLPLERTVPIVVVAPKEKLNDRIHQRFRTMVEQGALDECRAALPNWDPDLSSSRAIGARELIAYLQGQTDLETAIERATIATRQYAKRQRSWGRSNMKAWNEVHLLE